MPAGDRLVIMTGSRGAPKPRPKTENTNCEEALWTRRDHCTDSAVGRRLLIGAGVLLIVLGLIWALQGTGYIGGSVMTGSSFWTVAGTVAAVLGLSAVVAGMRGWRRR